MSGLKHYLRHHRRYELVIWCGILFVNWVANTSVSVIDSARAGGGIPFWKLVTWEGTSTLMIGLLLPVMLAFGARFPLRLGTLRRNLLAHLGFTVAWSVVHVAAMILLRKLVYAVVGESYSFGPVLQGFGYEYLKDFRSYFEILAIIYLYRFVLLRLQGEARFLAEGREEAPPAPVTDRFLVKKLGREFLVKVDDIDWIEAAGNYVNLHVGRRLYPLRETMGNIEQRLSEAGFVRVHRSAILNMDRVSEIEPFDTGDARARLTGGHVVPVSRRYRAALRAELG
ncbi:MAG: LytTR family DNA-binding domain-containing protein [Pseudomonadota bacterium]